jgi:hypothetical protein
MRPRGGTPYKLAMRGSIPFARSNPKPQVRGSAHNEPSTLRTPPTPCRAWRNESAGQAIIVSVLLADVVEVSVYRVRDGLVSAPRFVQVDHGGALAVVAHPRHQILDPGTRSRDEVVADVTQVMEVQVRIADRFDGARPAGHLVDETDATRVIDPPAYHTGLVIGRPRVAAQLVLWRV